MQTWVVFLGIVVLLGAPVAGFFLWLKVFGGPDGERLQKRRMQGPFVPLSPAEVEEDESRKRSAGQPGQAG